MGGFPSGFPEGRAAWVSVRAWDLATGERSLWERPDVPVDPSLVEVKQVWYESADGTKLAAWYIASTNGAAILLRLRALQDVLLRDAEGQTGRQREGLLRSGEHEVEAPLVRADISAARTRDAVDEQHHIARNDIRNGDDLPTAVAQY